MPRALPPELGAKLDFIESIPAINEEPCLIFRDFNAFTPYGNAICMKYDEQGSKYLPSGGQSEGWVIIIDTRRVDNEVLSLLSNRELQVLRRLAMGHTNHEIAEAYGISTKTVDTYRLRLLKKLNLRNNAELSRFAMQNKLIET